MALVFFALLVQELKYEIITAARLKLQTKLTEFRKINKNVMLLHEGKKSGLTEEQMVLAVQVS